MGALSLTNSLRTLFTNMNNDISEPREYTDEKFADDFTSAIVDYIKSGNVTTTDDGTIPTGAFVGSGTASGTNMTIPNESCSGKLKREFANLKDEAEKARDGYVIPNANQRVANIFTDAISDMIGDSTITLTTSGEVTTGTGAVSPMVGTSTGTFTITTSPFTLSLKTCFDFMTTKSKSSPFDRTFDGNEYFITNFVTAISTMFSTAKIPSTGTGTILGSSGTGKIIIV